MLKFAKALCVEILTVQYNSQWQIMSQCVCRNFLEFLFIKITQSVKKITRLIVKINIIVTMQ